MEGEYMLMFLGSIDSLLFGARKTSRRRKRKGKRANQIISVVASCIPLSSPLLGSFIFELGLLARALHPLYCQLLDEETRILSRGKGSRGLSRSLLEKCHSLSLIPTSSFSGTPNLQETLDVSTKLVGTFSGIFFLLIHSLLGAILKHAIFEPFSLPFLLLSLSVISIGNLLCEVADPSCASTSIYIYIRTEYVSFFFFFWLVHYRGFWDC